MILSYLAFKSLDDEDLPNTSLGPLLKQLQRTMSFYLRRSSRPSSLSRRPGNHFCAERQAIESL